MLNKKLFFSALSTIALFSSSFSPTLFAQDDKALLSTAIQADIRTEDEKARDSSRKPFETLQFFGIKKDMRVVELLPGGGWYTKILGSYLSEEGELYLSMRANPDRLNLEEWELNKAKIVGSGYEFSKTGTRGIFDVGPGEIGVNDADMVLTFRNLHNISAESRATLNDDVFQALKPGGIYGVIDHTRRHNTPPNDEIWRRLDPVVVIKEALDAGFEFEAFSNLHYNPADQLVYDSTHKSINRNSDRFTLKFRKPIN